LVLSPGERAAICALGVASHGLVVGDGRVVNSRECSVLVDADVIISSASLGVVPSAREAAV
jgi:hypothetical protein